MARFRIASWLSIGEDIAYSLNLKKKHTNYNGHSAKLAHNIEEQVNGIYDKRFQRKGRLHEAATPLGTVYSCHLASEIT